jgi:hypothetical protein
MREENHTFLKNGSGIFLRERLDRANQVELAQEKSRFGAANLPINSAGRWSTDLPRE